ncbi:hypothetical protein ACO2Q2_14295 [Dyella sp. KRB-257]|uniref:hypothetical protein n=1 Tax=Dyella sp. KRB-257 TaxID=3400915 RepID=UPI003C058D6C
MPAGTLPTHIRLVLIAVLCLAWLPAHAQSRPGHDLPGVTVTAPYTRIHGGYVVSGNFRVDERMPTVVFPAEALVKGDILSVQPVHLNDDEYLVLQECAVADCRMAHLVQVWNAGGAVGRVRNSEARVWIAHENKYFIWMQRLPSIQRDCSTCGSRFEDFQTLSPPMTLIPVGEEAARNRGALRAQPAVAVPVVAQSHEGATFVVRFAGGAVVRIRRMHAAS